MDSDVVIAVFYDTWFRYDDGFWEFHNYKIKVRDVHKVYTVGVENDIYETLKADQNFYEDEISNCVMPSAMGFTKNTTREMSKIFLYKLERNCQ